MATCINLTFKNNDDEIQMYMECISHSSRGNYIKDAIKFYMNYGHLEKELKQLALNEAKK